MMNKFNKTDIEKAISSLEMDLKNREVIAGLYLTALTEVDKKYWSDKFEEQTAKNVLIHKRISELTKMLSETDVFPKTLDFEGRN